MERELLPSDKKSAQLLAASVLFTAHCPRSKGDATNTLPDEYNYPFTIHSDRWQSLAFLLPPVA